MVAVVGGPAQGQLTKVAGADDQPAPLVGQVHQHLGPLPGLAVLEGDGQVLHGLADVPEVDPHCLANVHRTEVGAHALSQDLGVGLGPAGGAEAGHGDGQDVTPGPAQHIEGPGGDEQGQSGVQPAGQPHYRTGGPGVLQSLFQPQGSDGEDFLAPRLPVPSPLGDEGILSDRPGELCLLCAQGKGSAYPVGGLSVIGVHFPPLKRQPVYINLADGQPGLEAGFRQNRPVFRYDIVPGKDQVGGGLSLSGVGIDVAADQTPGLSRHQLTAVGGFASYLVGGGQIQNNSCAQSCQMGGWGRYSPKILAKLHSYRQIWHLFTHKQLAGIEVGILAAQRYR